MLYVKKNPFEKTLISARLQQLKNDRLAIVQKITDAKNDLQNTARIVRASNAISERYNFKRADDTK